MLWTGTSVSKTGLDSGTLASISGFGTGTAASLHSGAPVLAGLGYLATRSALDNVLDHSYRSQDDACFLCAFILTYFLFFGRHWLEV